MLLRINEANLAMPSCNDQPPNHSQDEVHKELTSNQTMIMMTTYICNHPVRSRLATTWIIVCKQGFLHLATLVGMIILPLEFVVHEYCPNQELLIQTVDGMDKADVNS